MKSRRDFLKRTGTLAFTAIALKITKAQTLFPTSNLLHSGGDAFQLPKLPYEYDALEPFIDKQTMIIHHTKHHQAYVNKLNETPSTNIDYLSDDSMKCSHVDQTTSSVIRNNLGGHYNHSLFWTLLRPNKDGNVNEVSGSLAEEIKKEWKTLEDFKKEFAEKAMKIFGSGWCWLINQNGKLKIVTTANQDNPLMNLQQEKGKIVLALDIWEHAYYLKHQNKRADYIKDWWNVVNWEKAQQLFEQK